MPKKLSFQDRMQDLSDKIDDMSWLFTLVMNSDFSCISSENMFGAFKCILTLLKDIQRDIISIQEDFDISGC